MGNDTQVQMGTCRYLVADDKVCGTKLMKRYNWDYYFCPACSPEQVKENIKDLFRKRVTNAYNRKRN